MILNGKKFTWAGVDVESTPSWSSLKLAADLDRLGLLTAWNAGLISIGTIPWLGAHSIEKYFKAILLKADPKVDYKKYRHDLVKLWINAAPLMGKDARIFDPYINELNGVRPDVRYGHPFFSSSGFLAITSYIGGCCRYFLVGEEQYRSSELGYGFGKDLFMPGLPGTRGSEKVRVQRLLHLLFEHEISVSGMGIPDSFSWAGVDVETAPLKTNRRSELCPWCNGTRGGGQALAQDIASYYAAPGMDV